MLSGTISEQPGILLLFQTNPGILQAVGSGDGKILLYQ